MKTYCALGICNREIVHRLGSKEEFPQDVTFELRPEG